MIVLAATLAALAAIGAALGRVPGESAATRLTRAMLIATAALIAVEIALGVAGRLGATSTLITLLALAASGWAWRWRHPHARAPQPRTPWTAIEAGLASALAVALLLRLHAGWNRTTFLYDTLSYHLHMPATWLHAGRLEIVPAVFGDPASAYAPANLELVFLALMAPLRSDALASVGQLPFAALATAAIVAAVRESGGGRAAALGAALAFLLVPEVWTQAPTAMTDLGLAAFLLASLPFGWRLAGGRPHPAGADLVALAVALGLAIGSKYAGAVLALPFAAAVVVTLARPPNGPRPRDLSVAAAVVVALGGFWYLRNLAVAGNPWYPVATLGFPGLYDRRAMLAWDYHLPIGDIRPLGGMLAASGAGFASASFLALGRGWRGRELPMVAALLALFWLAIPYQESRFLFPALGVAAVAIGREVDRASPPALGATALAIVIVAALLEWPTPERAAALAAGAIAALSHAGWRRLPARARTLAAGTAAVGVAAAIAVGVHRYEARDPGYAVGDAGLEQAWRWMRANVHDARVAYTGTNLAFPLSGAGLSNQVSYVNVAGAPTDRLHDFARRLPGLRATAEPAPYRDGADAAIWRSNLRAARTGVLFVAALYPIVRRDVPADADGFPIERAWADAQPALFKLRYASAAARVYEVVP